MCIHVNPASAEPSRIPASPDRTLLTWTLQTPAWLVQPLQTSLCARLCALTWEVASPGEAFCPHRRLPAGMSLRQRLPRSVPRSSTLPGFRLRTALLPEMKMILFASEQARRLSVRLQQLAVPWHTVGAQQMFGA